MKDQLTAKTAAENLRLKIALSLGWKIFDKGRFYLISPNACDAPAVPWMSTKKAMKWDAKEQSAWMDDAECAKKLLEISGMHVWDRGGGFWCCSDVPEADLKSAKIVRESMSMPAAICYGYWMWIKINKPAVYEEIEKADPGSIVNRYLFVLPKNR